MLVFIVVDVFPPGQYVSTIGGTATFTCSVSDGPITGVQWLVNGSELEDLNLPMANVEAVFETHETGSGHGILRFRNVPVEYNETRVTCIAITVAMGMIRATDSSLLLEQGMEIGCVF